MTTTAAHVLASDCPLWCLEHEIPTNAFNALKHELRWKAGGHPTVGQVIDLYQHEQLAAIRGIGLCSIARIGDVLDRAGILIEPRRDTAAGQPGS
jgi:hypothetical protein